MRCDAMRCLAMRRGAYRGETVTLVTTREDAMTTDSETARRAVTTTPIGELLLVARAGALCEIHLPDAASDAPRETEPSAADAVLEEATRQLHDYFAGRRREFDLPLRPEGSEFQRRVWLALRSVGYGETVTYGQLARAIDRPAAARAVGAALARNPLPLVLPCHRVIGARGDLRGFAGGVALKRRLLETEAARRDTARRSPRQAAMPAVGTRV
jgi:methylated-DNA-[protein]-cysteine S-methyltransferase